jgi:antitoxin component HigA of HigAB toxin-antitoxin module
MSRGKGSAPGPLTRALARLLSDAFDDSFITQKTLGDLVGMSKSSVSRALRGETVLDMEQFSSICHELGVPADAILADAMRSAGA